VSDDWPVAGTLLAARYRLVSLLETGGMAEIWRADDELLGRPVAIKLSTGPAIAWREARMAARLSHPGIAAVHDYREAVRADGAVQPFVVMELLAGESVAHRLLRSPVPWDETARIGAKVAEALAVAHGSGVVHRDIKPGNVMLTPNGVKLLDFGISVPAGEPDDDDTGATFGTPAYVAPERLDGKPAEPATDVYGLGVLLFEMVTGDPPYPVETWEELAEARVAGPSVLPATLPDGFRAIVGRCLDEEPHRRPSAAQLRDALTALAPPAPEKAPVETPRPGYATGRASAATLAMTRAPERRRLALTLSAVAVVVAAGGALAAASWSHRTTDADPAPLPPVVLSAAPTAPSPTPTLQATTASTPPPSPSATLTFDDAVGRLRSAVQRGAADGQIREDVATDLLNLMQPLATAEGSNVTDRVDQIRRKIRQRVGEGSVTQARATVLQSRLADLDRAAGT
jgi:serine/threonine protein kinase